MTTGVRKWGKMHTIDYKDLGVMPYGECLAKQHALFERMLARQHEAEAADDGFVGTVLMVEHNPVYTLGKSGKESNLLIDEARLRALGAEFHHIDRGGDITFHGRGQIVCYPILDLGRLGIGLRRYIEILEQAVIDTIARYGICGRRLEGATGVWICDDYAPQAQCAEGDRAEKTPAKESEGRNWRKICAIGVRASRYVTMHGLALNVATDLRWFTMINPCGFTDKGVTSIAKEVGTDEVGIGEVKALLLNNLTRLLGVATEDEKN